MKLTYKQIQHFDNDEFSFFVDKPVKTKIEVPEEGYLREKLVINCYSEGLPSPSFSINHNVTRNIVSNNSSYIKEKVDYSDAGLYECVAKNVLGNDSDIGKLIVKGKITLQTHHIVFFANHRCLK